MPAVVSNKLDWQVGNSLIPGKMATTTQTRPVVFMDINIGETPAGRIKFELYSDITPK